MDLRPILIRYVLQLTGGKRLLFAVEGGNILSHTPNVGFNCVDFLARAGLVVRQDRKTWAFCLLGGPGAHHSDQFNTYRCYEYRVLHILPFLSVSIIILGLA